MLRVQSLASCLKDKDFDSMVLPKKPNKGQRESQKLGLVDEDLVGLLKNNQFLSSELQNSIIWFRAESSKLHNLQKGIH